MHIIVQSESYQTRYQTTNYEKNIFHAGSLNTKLQTNST